MITTRSFAVLGLSLIIALTIFGVQVVKAVKKGREFDRYLTVRGLSEREVRRLSPSGQFGSPSTPMTSSR